MRLQQRPAPGSSSAPISSTAPQTASTTQTATTPSTVQPSHAHPNRLKFLRRALFCAALCATGVELVRFAPKIVEAYQRASCFAYTGGFPSKVAYSPDGKILAVATMITEKSINGNYNLIKGNKIQLFDTDTGKFIQDSIYKYHFNEIQFSKDGKNLYALSLPVEKCLRIHVPTKSVTPLQLDSDLKQVSFNKKNGTLLGIKSGEIQVIDPESGKYKAFKIKKNDSANAYSNSSIYSSQDNRFIAFDSIKETGEYEYRSVVFEKSVRLLDTKTGREYAIEKLKSTGITGSYFVSNSLFLAHDQKYVYITGNTLKYSDSTLSQGITLFNLETGKTEKSQRLAWGASIESVTPRGEIRLTNGEDTVPFIWTKKGDSPPILYSRGMATSPDRKWRLVQRRYGLVREPVGATSPG